LGSEATDKLFNLAAEYLDEGIFGARISGGGNGGTVVILGRRGADAAVAEIADRYHSETGNPPMIISGSSNGAHAFGALRLARQTVN
jgi:L-arabinokinase